MNVLVARRAELEIARIDAWWRENRLAAPDLFARELAGAVWLLSVAPGAGRIFSRRPNGEVRRLRLAKSRYHVYYRRSPGEDALVIVSVWSEVRGQPPRV